MASIALIIIGLLFSSRIFKLSPVISFLLAGIIVGPTALNLLPTSLTTSSPAGELAIASLLFLVGLELDSSAISWKNKRRILMGVWQVLLAALFIGILFYLSGYGTFNSIRLGFLCAMSSTAVVLVVLEQRGDTHAVYALNATSVLIVQDLFAVILLAVMALPATFSDSQEIISSMKIFGKLIVFVPIVFLISRFVLPKLLKSVVQRREPEFFMFTLLLLVVGSSFIGHALFGSAAMGAFIAGFALAGSPMAYQIRSDIDPFKLVLLSLFFLMIGASFNIFIFETHWLQILIFLISIPLIKAATNFIAMKVTKNDVYSSLKTSLALSQVGEFSLLLAVVAHSTGWLDTSSMQIIFAVAIVTMGLTPSFINFAHSKLLKNLCEKFNVSHTEEILQSENEIQAIIIGYGIAGQKCGEQMTHMGLHFSVIEQNPKTVEKLMEKGIPAIFGDASRKEILQAAGIEKAKWLIIAVPSPVDRLSITCEVRLQSEEIHIIVRSHYVKEETFLKEVGANIVISEEETVSAALANALQDEFVVES
ncbi:MAG: hypothetical protein COA79_08820 [Planctomycetota bacterium]|nr:MAG: hypothetical protein COA79_08820 [Planctomycetota bacterium]